MDVKLLILNGPNLNLLGLREPELYGTRDYAALCRAVEDYCRAAGASCEQYQSNHEGALVDQIQAAYGVYDGLVINPAAYTHTSIAIPDALRAVSIPTVEVHLTDILTREDYRRISYVSEVALARFMGRGFDSYREAIDWLTGYLRRYGAGHG